MDKAVILSFSERGRTLAARAAHVLEGRFEVSCEEPRGNLKERTAQLFSSCGLIVFIGACGIAVRAVAPSVASKTSDPAVVVADELGKNVISLLSGHMGGANDIARLLAEGLGANPVITTATDINGRFSVDSWAKKNGFLIDSMEAARLFSAEILEKDLPVYSELPAECDPSKGIYFGQKGAVGAAVSYRRVRPYASTLRVIPRVLYMGIGCRRGTSAEQIERAVSEALDEYDIDFRAVAGIASLDLKKDEAGLLEYCRLRGIEPSFYTAEELLAVPGDYSSSSFVESKVGVDNVCERAAMLLAGENAALIIRKTASEGVTVALAQAERRIRFE